MDNQTKRYLDIQFEFVGFIEPQRHDDGTIIAEMPQERYAKKDMFSLNKYGSGPFCKFKIAKGYNTSGVYLIAHDSEILYVGECAHLAKRYSSSGYGGISPKNCYVGGQETNCRINNLIYQSKINGHILSLWFYKFLTDKPSRCALERQLIVNLKPRWNR